jgi:multiple sugar transport system substrate-binding protein
MQHLQKWITKMRYVDPNVDDNAFVGKRVALSWVGHWQYRRYADAFGDDLVLLPLPDFGQGSRTGQGSWNWGITTRCRHPQAAARFLEFLLADEQVLAMCNANSAVPATWTGIARSALYREGSPLRLFARQLTEGSAVPRPRTPAYPVITSVFQQAFDDIRHGADVQTALDKAAADIDQDIHDNRGYPQIKGQDQPR